MFFLSLKHALLAITTLSLASIAFAHPITPGGTHARGQVAKGGHVYKFPAKYRLGTHPLSVRELPDDPDIYARTTVDIAPAAQKDMERLSYSPTHLKEIQAWHQNVALNAMHTKKALKSEAVSATITRGAHMKGIKGTYMNVKFKDGEGRTLRKNLPGSRLTTSTWHIKTPGHPPSNIALRIPTTDRKPAAPPRRYRPRSVPNGT